MPSADSSTKIFAVIVNANQTQRFENLHKVNRTRFVNVLHGTQTYLPGYRESAVNQ